MRFRAYGRLEGVVVGEDVNYHNDDAVARFVASKGNFELEAHPDLPDLLRELADDVEEELADGDAET